MIILFIFPSYQFMKKVNRIRFNSLTSNSSSNEDFDNVAAFSVPGRRRHRPRSCPPFKRSSSSLSFLSENSPPSRRSYHQHSHLTSSRGGRKQVAPDRSAVFQQRENKVAFSTQRSVPGDGSYPSEVHHSEDSSDDILSCGELYGTES